MRLSITLDPELHRLAASRARARRTSISREINTLLRQAISNQAARPATATGSPGDPARHTPDPDSGLLISEGKLRFAVSPGRGPLTEADIRHAEDEEDLRHWNS
jgi:hypothetical protein